MIWQDSDINRFAFEAEQLIANEVNCINKRISIPITKYQPAYILPEDIIFIRRVTWKGKKLEPIPFQKYSEFKITNPEFKPGMFSHAFSTAFCIGTTLIGTPAGQPYSYFYNGFGENTIRFFPSPGESLAPAIGNLYAGDVLRASAVVEYWALPDTVNQRVPSFVRRRLVKSYVLSRCLMMETPGQDLDGSKFFQSMFNNGLEMFKQINSNLYYSKPSNLGDNPSSKFILGRPTLKYKYMGF